jgi:hypothetical protein
MVSNVKFVTVPMTHSTKLKKKSIILCANRIFDRVLHRQNDQEKKVIANEMFVHELIHAYVPKSFFFVFSFPLKFQDSSGLQSISKFFLSTSSLL